MSNHYHVQVPLPTQRIADTMCAGIEGGVNYWCRSMKPLQGWPRPEGEELAPQQDETYFGSSCWYGDPRFWADPNFRVVVREDDPGVERNPSGRWEFGRVELQAALDGLANGTFPAALRHLNDILQENEDADTGDVLIQLCCFGEVVYG